MREARVLIPRAAALVAVVLGATCAAHAGGPLVVNGAGEPLAWLGDPIPYNPDRGTLGALSNASALGRLATSAAVWTAVPSATVSIAAAASLPVDVTVGNYATYLFACGDGLSPIVFDTDGSITDELLGDAANEDVLGFASPACGTYVPPVIDEGFAVMNGRFLDGVDTAGNPELTAAEFDAVLVHELGHYIGLDHTQVNLQEAIDDIASNDDAIATMFPVLISPSEAGSLHLDDVVAVSALYPEAAFDTDFAAITGSILRPDGVTPFQGANVVARAVADPRATAVSQVSGARYFPGRDGGPPDPALRGHYELLGLPPGSYTVEIERIHPGFSGGSSVGPLQIPVPLPGPPELWNGIDESASNPPDDPSASEAIAVTAGASVDSIDITINESPPPANDECAAAVDVGALPFADTINAVGATRGAFDPLQSCSKVVGCGICSPSAAQNFNSFWYRFTPEVDGVVSATTAGSNYDTIVSALTGACGSLVEAGCDDDGGPASASDLDVFTEAGIPYLFEVTSIDSGAGLAEVAFDFAPAASCPSSPQTGCRAPASTDGSFLRLRHGDDPAKYLLQWKWLPGDVPAGELGDPSYAAGTSYAVCMYDAGGTLSLAARAPAGDRCGSGTRECWRTRSASIAYRDSELMPDGLRALNAKSVSGERGKISVRGAGGTLDVPSLPVAFPVTVQLVNSDGHCWEAVFPTSGVQRNDDSQVKARGG